MIFNTVNVVSSAIGWANERSQKLAEEQKKIVEEKSADLGPISKDEWFSMAALAVFFTGMIILPYYKINTFYFSWCLTNQTCLINKSIFRRVVFSSNCFE